MNANVNEIYIYTHISMIFVESADRSARAWSAPNYISMQMQEKVSSIDLCYIVLYLLLLLLTDRMKENFDGKPTSKQTYYFYYIAITRTLKLYLKQQQTH